MPKPTRFEQGKTIKASAIVDPTAGIGLPVREDPRARNRFLAIQVVAEVPALSMHEREQITKAISLILGCNDTEKNCPMILLNTCIVSDVDKALKWVDGD